MKLPRWRKAWRELEREESKRDKAKKGGRGSTRVCEVHVEPAENITV
jgi:hypothetical protein